ncbi:serine hydrolase family protein, partial [Candidatus Uhrbacteria bacterium]|nr:serine hydrolase family protein [Candidatus Uhrbacteria bacterium]
MPSKKKNSAPIKLVLLHGYAGNSGNVWFPWLHRLAEGVGWRVWAPQLPNPLKPDYGAWMGAVRSEAKSWNGDTVIVGHSMGGVLALRILAETGVRVGAVITVSTPFGSPVPVRQLIRFFSDPIDWVALRRQAGAFVTVHSRNDPLIPFDAALRYGETLKSRLILTEKDGHFIGRQAKAVWGE